MAPSVTGSRLSLRARSFPSLFLLLSLNLLTTQASRGGWRHWDDSPSPPPPSKCGRQSPPPSPPPPSPPPPSKCGRQSPPPPPPSSCRKTPPPISVNNDPHFVGAHGTHFEFNGLPGQSVCLFTDRSLHINMKLAGYLDDRLEGASVLADGKAVRTWIRQLAVMWRDGAGTDRSLLIAAREGPVAERGEIGFLARAELDHAPLPDVQPGQSLSLAGGLNFTYLGPGSTGVFDTNEYLLSVPGLFNLGIQLRAAHPLLRTPTDAMAHINVNFGRMFPSEAVHGVMGQTFRQGRAARAEEYSLLGRLMGRAVAADGPSGEGFLDGKTEDYLTTDVYAANCKYTAFNDAAQ